MFVLKIIIWKICNDVNKGGLNKGFHSKLYRSNILYLAHSESCVKICTREEYLEQCANFNINVFDCGKGKKMVNCPCPCHEGIEDE
jgi:hypothetical protein